MEGVEDYQAKVDAEMRYLTEPLFATKAWPDPDYSLNASVNTWGKGRVPLDHIGLWDAGGVDFEEVFTGLHEIGYRGFVTVHQAFAGIMSVENAINNSYEYLKPLTDS